MSEHLSSENLEVAVVRDLCNCKACNSNLVQPLERYPTSDGHWTALLRCPDCEQTSLGLYSKQEMDNLEIAHFDGIVKLDLTADIFDVIDRRNLKEEGYKFFAALRAGHILPEDFGM